MYRMQLNTDRTELRVHSPAHVRADIHSYLSGAKRIDFLEPLIRHILHDSPTKQSCSIFKNNEWDSSPMIANSFCLQNRHSFCLAQRSPRSHFPISEKLLIPGHFNRVQWHCHCPFYMYFKCWQAWICHFSPSSIIIPKQETLMPMNFAASWRTIFSSDHF